MQVDIFEIIFGAVVVFLSSLIQGMTGFGFALLAVPLLTIFIAPGQAVPILVIFSLLTNIFILAKSYKHVKLKEFWLLIAFSVISTPVGVYILKVISAESLKLIAGIVIILIALALLRGYKVKIKNYTLSSIIAGLVSGVLKGSLSMSGPPVVLFLSNQGVGKEYFRANLTAQTLIINISAIITFIAGGLMNMQVIAYAGIMSPALAAGVLAGILIAARVREEIFKKVTLYLIIVMGVFAVATTIGRML